MAAALSASDEGGTKAPLPSVGHPGENSPDQVTAAGDGSNVVAALGSPVEPTVLAPQTEPTAEVVAAVQDTPGPAAPQTRAPGTEVPVAPEAPEAPENGTPATETPPTLEVPTPEAAVGPQGTAPEPSVKPSTEVVPTPEAVVQPQEPAEPNAATPHAPESSVKPSTEEQASASEIATSPETAPVTGVQTTLENAKEEKQPKENGAGSPTDENQAASNGDEWKKRETELLSTIADLEKLKTECSTDGLSLQVKVRDEEIDILKSRIKTLETELAAALTKPGAKNHEVIEKIKEQHEELLNKAKGMIFDKTKMVKNQELQIQALTSQVASLKDVASITKDLLEIRNAEVKHLEDRLEAMDGRFKAERERHNLMLKRSENNTKINDDLKKEYETQLALFKELRDKYEQRVKALVTENEKLQDLLKAHNEAKEQK